MFPYLFPLARLLLLIGAETGPQADRQPEPESETHQGAERNVPKL